MARRRYYGRRRRGGRRSGLSKVGRKAGSLVGTTIQVLGLLHGTLAGIQRAGFNAETPREILYEYSGIQRDGVFNSAQLVKSVTIIAASFGVGWAIKQMARRM